MYLNSHKIKLLKATIRNQNTLLEEANPYDNKYGIGKNGDGQNITGKCLMQVRDLIAEKKNNHVRFKETWHPINNGYIMHQVNCQNVMGAGVAKAPSIQKYPRVKEAYHEFATNTQTPKTDLEKYNP